MKKLKQLITDCIKRAGADKFAHFGIGATITALVGMFVGIATDVGGWLWVALAVAGMCLTMALEVIKEEHIDSESDKADYLWTFAGSALVVLVTALAVLVRHISGGGV